MTVFDGEWITDQVVARLQVALAPALAQVDATLECPPDTRIYPCAMPLLPDLPAIEVVVPDTDWTAPDVAGRHLDGTALVFVVTHLQHEDTETAVRRAHRYNQAVVRCLAGNGMAAQGAVVQRVRMGVQQGADPDRQTAGFVTAGSVALELGVTGSLVG